MKANDFWVELTKAAIWVACLFLALYCLVIVLIEGTLPQIVLVTLCLISVAVVGFNKMC